MRRLKFIRILKAPPLPLTSSFHICTGMKNENSVPLTASDLLSRRRRKSRRGIERVR